MRTQPISKTNFEAGKLVYITKNSEKYTENISNRLPKVYREYKKSINEALKKEPFDVLITRGENPLEFVVKASDGKSVTSPQVVRLKVNQSWERGNEYYENGEDFASAIFSSITNFKKGNIE